MHLEPGGSEDPSSLPSLDVPTPQRARGVPKADLEPGAVPRRDGLPKAYRMRHGRHYVEQLMGDAPLRTIRDVAVTEFHEPPDTGADLTALQASIKDHGMLEPLVVAPDEGRYRIIGGAKRFRAALAAGLQTLPCIVHDLHGHSFEVLRSAAQRAVALEPERQAAPAARVAQTAPPQGQRAFAALDAAVDEALRLAVLTDLVNVERHRAEVMAAAEGVLGTEASAVRGEVVADSILEGVIERIRTEARLRNVTVDASVQSRDYRVAADPRLVSLAIECMSRSMLALCCGSATNVRISVEGDGSASGVDRPGLAGLDPGGRCFGCRLLRLRQRGAPGRSHGRADGGLRPARCAAPRGPGGCPAAPAAWLHDDAGGAALRPTLTATAASRRCPSAQAPRDQLGAWRRYVRVLHDFASIHDLYRPIQFRRRRGRARASHRTLDPIDVVDRLAVGRHGAAVFLPPRPGPRCRPRARAPPYRRSWRSSDSQIGDAGADVFPGIVGVRHAVSGRRRGHQLHQPHRALDRPGAG